jgi:pilus assembly protein CpaB
VSRIKRSLIAVAVAVVLAAFGAASILLYVRSADDRALQGKRAVTVLLASRRVTAGTTGEQLRGGGLLVAVSMPATAVPPDALSTIDDSLDDLVLTADLQPRQLVLRGAFGEASRLSGGLSIPDGKLAVTVDIAGLPTVSFLRPGSKVAVFNTYDPRTPDSRVPDGNKGPQFAAPQNHITRLLMPRLEVVGIGLPGQTGAATTTTDPSAEAKAATAAQAQSLTAVTFAVTQDEAERIILASQTGLLYIALLDDSSEVRPGPGVDTKSLFP